MRTRPHFIHIDQIGYTNEKVAELQKQKRKKEAKKKREKNAKNLLVK